MDIAEYYHFRCFTETIVLDDLVTFLKEQSNVLLIVFEESKITHRPHIHATVRFPKAVNTFRDKLRQKFPNLFGNKSYSICKVRDYDSNLKYCCKGKPSDYPEVLYTSLGNDEIKQYYNEYWQVQDSILKAKAKSKDEVNMDCQNDPLLIVEAKSKVKSLTWSEKLTKTIIRDYPLMCDGFVQYHNNKSVDYDLLHEGLTGVILEHLGKHSKNLDEFILIRLYNAQINAIIQQCGDDGAKRNFKKELSQKIKHKTF